MSGTLPAGVTLAQIASRLQPYESLRIDADGSVHLVRSYQARTIGDLEIACQGYERGDHCTVRRHDAYWLVELSRPLSQIAGIDSDL